MDMIASFNLKRGEMIGNYKLKEFLGRSCESEVYRVQDKYSGSERAIKLFFLFYDFSHVARFSAKLERLKGVRGILNYYHAGYWDKHTCHYLVLELVIGKDLAILSRSRPFPVFKALKVAHELFRILASCHEKGECLGDLNIDNIILSQDGRVKVIDFEVGVPFTKRKIKEDIISVCEIFYGLNWNLGPYPRDLLRVIPKGRQTIQKRYGSANQALNAIEELIDVSGKLSSWPNKMAR